MAAGSYRTTLTRPGLWPFLWTQFLGAFNDNVFKIVVILLAATAPGRDGTRDVALAGAVFIAPFLLFSGYAGDIADRFGKRRVLVTMKIFEIVAMALAIPALASGRFALHMAVLFLMGTQATFFSPAKYGIVPEIVPDEDLSRANGLLEMSTFLAIVLGTAIGGPLLVLWRDHAWWIGVGLTVIAIGGTIASLRIPDVPAARPAGRIAINPFGEVWRAVRRLWPDRTLWMTTIGVSYFWLLGALLQMALPLFGQHALRVADAEISWLLTALAIGIGLGSLVAGRLSGDKVELGLVPIGSIGMGVFSLWLAAAPPSFVQSAIALVLIGFFGGWFVVPLNALLQQRPRAEEKGRVLAANNVLNTLGIILASAALTVLGDVAGLTATQIIASAGVFTLLSNTYVLAKLPDFFIRFSLWLLTHTIYRIKIVGKPNIPQRGPALIIANHVSMIDGALVGACIQRFVRFLVYGPYYRMPFAHGFLRRMHAIPVTAGNHREVAEAIEEARAALAAGHVVCIFAEGAVSRTGNLLPFKHGFERIVHGLDVPIVPVYLDRVWGSIFSFKREKFFWKLPERLPYPVTVAFGEPLPSSVDAQEVRRAIMELGAEAMRYRRTPSDQLHVAFARVARRRFWRFAMADSTGQRLSYGKTLLGSTVLGRAIRRRTGDEANVGILLPASVGGAVTNIATFMAGKVPVNLNFTIGPEALDAAIKQAEIRTILTSAQFIRKASIEPRPEMVFLEDLRKTIGLGDKVIGAIEAALKPARWLGGRSGRRDRTHALATIIFSSGSTGVPKGVMLTHANLLANVDGLAQIFPMTKDDCFVGVLPFFHSFGFTGTLWFPLIQGCGMAFHPNPMDGKTIGELFEKYRGSMLISTPTFCQAYLRRCTREQFAHLKYAIVGAEKLRPSLAAAFKEQFGVDLLEGYGCTEMGPVVCVSRPNIMHPHNEQLGRKPGSVGHPIPGVAVKVVDQNTGEGPLIGKEGLLLVTGPNLMTGYLKQPERTAEAMRDGWYVTGDIGMVDEDGFVFITDRLSRFSKIGGEMVPHLKVEEAINAILGESASVVTAVPDASRGERLVAFYTKAEIAPEALWERLCQTDLPKLWIPKRECLLPIEAIPTLGTGKIDLRRVRALASERVTAEVAQ
ncbi:MAG TPA: acyl-[ACP]--phospholipid O-acyltransferase [Vicinamibacterales bacterium]|nr:acyl-[ACP]--phospholipid O-acyltransferase [Vicinamibacterales bacterium]